jgi:hypothetical protein
MCEENTERPWDNRMRDVGHLSSIQLRKWHLFYQPRDERNADMFEKNLKQFARSMGFEITDAKKYDFVFYFDFSLF